MTTPDRNMGERSRDEVIAGEYVLGVLNPVGRREVEARMRRDAGFAAIVNRWRDNLLDFDESYYGPQIAKPDRRTERDTERSVEPGLGARLWGSVSLWRALCLTAAIGGAVYAAFGSGTLIGLHTGETVLPMTGGTTPIGLTAYYDPRSGSLSFSPVAAGAGEKALQVWLTGNGGTAVPLGVLPQSGEAMLTVPQNKRSMLMTGAKITVSIEPAGGTPASSAMGPVVAHSAAP